MPRQMRLAALMVPCLISLHSTTQAQIPILDIIKAGIKKVIIAVDLRVQRLQNKTIALQNAEKALENQMAKLHLSEIADFVEKNRKLYADYFEELRTIKSALIYFQRMRDIINTEQQLINEYRTTWALLKNDKSFSITEIDYMGKIYAGILLASSKELDELEMVANSFIMRMNDAKRLQIINSVADNIHENLMDLKRFNNQNKMISIQRASDQTEIDYVKKLYGL